MREKSPFWAIKAIFLYKVLFVSFFNQTKNRSDSLPNRSKTPNQNGVEHRVLNDLLRPSDSWGITP